MEPLRYTAADASASRFASFEPAGACPLNTLQPTTSAAPTASPSTIGIDGRYLTDDFPGIGRYTFELLRALPAVAGPTAFRAVVPPAGGGRRFPLEALERAGIDLLETDLRVRSLAEQRRLPRLVDRLGCEIWHAPYYVTAYAVRRPLVITVFDAVGSHDPRYLPNARARLAYRFLTHLALRRARRVITLSTAARDDLARRFGVRAERIAVTPAGVGDAFTPATAGAQADVRARLDLPLRYALYLGIDKPHKNLVRLIEAWAHLASRNREPDPAVLVVAGYRDARYPETRRRAETLGLVPTVLRFLGPVDDHDLPALYSAAELFVLPSLIEGFGLPVLEAMACGTAVACARSASLPEVAGDAAAYFDPRSVDDIASTVGRLLDEPDRRDRLASAGRARAGTFTWERTAAATVEVYRAAARAPAGTRT